MARDTIGQIVNCRPIHFNRAGGVLKGEMVWNRSYWVRLGFLLKKSGKSELELAINEVSEGGNYFSQELMRSIIFNRGEIRHIENRDKRIFVKITKREYEVLELVCQGFSNNEISEKLFISPKTVEGHKTKLMSKTDSHNTAGLIIYAIKNKLVEI